MAGRNLRVCIAAILAHTIHPGTQRKGSLEDVFVSLDGGVMPGAHGTEYPAANANAIEPRSKLFVTPRPRGGDLPHSLLE